MFLLLTLLTLALAAQVPTLDIPAPPEWQDGDDEPVTIALGDMRQALYYYKIVPILKDHIEVIEDIAIETSREADFERQLRLDLERDLATVKSQRNIAVLTGAGIMVLGGMALLVQ
jgi:hypothetical protein